ncbi:hypothetical protein LOD99_12583 [Oopsacas minuta]|uniref:dual-specificity kinase n=1 Tax=Oopsacas minuta TaxID=111878 RepID=A0AAV7JCJ6_9METZ|nr:hypothetical protein LOD99_12583 [Oopsacas minuta]
MSYETGGKSGSKTGGSFIPSILRIKNNSDKTKSGISPVRIGGKPPDISSPITYYGPSIPYRHSSSHDARLVASNSYSSSQSKSKYPEIQRGHPLSYKPPLLSTGTIENDTSPSTKSNRPSKNSTGAIAFPCATKPSYLPSQKSPSSDTDLCKIGRTAPQLHQPTPLRTSPAPFHKLSTSSIDNTLICLPYAPSTVLKLYKDRISAYEQKEVEKYPEIWFFGGDAKKIQAEPGKPFNNGFDDDNGSYRKVTNDHIAYRYESLETIGKGSFGQVVKAYDHRAHINVAIKVIRNKKRFHHQALVEVKILDHLKRKDKDGTHNIIQMLEHFYFRNHLCIVFELLSINLYEMIKKNQFQGFSLSLVRKLAISMLHCLRLLYRERIIHCDLKPENILLRARNQYSIKVIDFGSSCYEEEKIYTYIQSRFYRSPEVILGLAYGIPIDMWSFGCILAELHTGYPLFPGNDEYEQLACIMEIMGVPPMALLEDAQRKRVFFDESNNPRQLTNSKGKVRKPSTKLLGTALKTDDHRFIDFIKRALTWDPNLRMTPDEALLHDWVQDGKAKTRPLPKYKAPASTYSSGSTSVLSGYSHSSLPHTKEQHIAPFNTSLIDYHDFKTGKVDCNSKMNEHPIVCGKMSSNKEMLDSKNKLEVSRDAYLRHNSVCIPQAMVPSSKPKKDFAYYDLTKVSHNEGRRYSQMQTSQKDFTQSLQRFEVKNKNYGYGEFDNAKKETTSKKDYTQLGPSLSYAAGSIREHAKPISFSHLPRLSSNKEF